MVRKSPTSEDVIAEEKKDTEEVSERLNVDLNDDVVIVDQ